MVVRSHISKRCDPERRGAIQSTQGSAHGHSGLICETDSVLLTAQVGWKDFSSKHPQDNSCTTGRVYLFSLEESNREFREFSSAHTATSPPGFAGLPGNECPVPQPLLRSVVIDPQMTRELKRLLGQSRVPLWVSVPQSAPVSMDSHPARLPLSTLQGGWSGQSPCRRDSPGQS